MTKSATRADGSIGNGVDLISQLNFALFTIAPQILTASL